MGRAQMPLWVQLRRREIERQGEEEVTASLQLTRRRRHLFHDAPALGGVCGGEFVPSQCGR